MASLKWTNTVDTDPAIQMAVDAPKAVSKAIGSKVSWTTIELTKS